MSVANFTPPAFVFPFEEEEEEEEAVDVFIIMCNKVTKLLQRHIGIFCFLLKFLGGNFELKREIVRAMMDVTIVSPYIILK